MNYLISKLALRLTLSIIAVLLLLFFTSSVFSQTGYLFIESVPERAEIMIDGKEYYRYFTPVLCTLAVGEHKVTVTKPYYQPETFSVTVTAETVTRKLVHFVLEDLATPSKRDAVIVK
ncbi:MAG: PEGA domain-containing protein, partial [candidate division Zixibacteria bacterium]|nr:PEGA domain-containing protein [candidate division Zixibacteria bacterium]